MTIRLCRSLLAATFILFAPVVSATLCDAYFPFDGSLADISGNGYNGELVTPGGEVVTTTRFVRGQVGIETIVATGYGAGPRIGSHGANVQAWGRGNEIRERLACGVLLRLDPEVRPTIFHAALLSERELTALQTIRNVIRMGRVTDLGQHQITLEHGTISTSPEHLHVDCSASAILGPSMADIKPIFQNGLILPQTVRSFQPTFSAAAIAHIEIAYANDEIKNELCRVVPLPNHDSDWLPMTLVNMANMKRWSEETELMAWQQNNRLNGFAQLEANAAGDPAKEAVIQKMFELMLPAATNLMTLMEKSGR